MSSWQSFFNQLSRPHQNDSNSTSEIICQCSKGNLMKNVKMEFIYTGECDSSCFCAIIEIDKQNARKFSNSISITQTEAINTDKNELTHLDLLDQFINKKNDI